MRLMMKAHSFVRENVPRVLAWCKEKNGTFWIQPGFHLHLLSDGVLTFPLWWLFVCLFVFIYFHCHLQALVQWSLRFLSISTSCLHPHSSTETSTPGTVFCSLSWSIYRTLFFVLFYSRAVKAPFLSCLLQESGDSVGLRGLKITSGTNLWHIYSNFT